MKSASKGLRLPTVHALPHAREDSSWIRPACLAAPVLPIVKSVEVLQTALFADRISQNTKSTERSFVLMSVRAVSTLILSTRITTRTLHASHVVKHAILVSTCRTTACAVASTDLRALAGS